MSNKSLKNWCSAALPSNFSRVTAETSQMQQFLREHLPEPVNQQVAVINVSPNEVVVAVSSPQIANFLRLYSSEIQQQIQESFNTRQLLKIRTMPGSLLQVSSRPKALKPTRLSADAVDKLVRSTDWVEDESLRQILKSLAKSMKPDS